MGENNVPIIDLGKQNITKGTIQVVTPNAPTVNPQAGQWGTPMIDKSQIKSAVVQLEEDRTRDDKQSIPHGELLKTLYFIFDTFKPFGIQFFPVRQTAKDMLAGRELSGDRIDVGIRKNEWNDTSKFYIYHNFDNEHVETLSRNTDQEEYMKDGVKIVFHLYPDNDCITYLANIQYEYENWEVPQRFEEFCKKYDEGGDLSEK